MSDEGTTNEDYRWKKLSTIIVLGYGLGFPVWVMGSTIAHYSLSLDGTLMSVLVLVWLACIIYAIGPENLKAAKELRDE